jgi:hypothetical protein
VVEYKADIISDADTQFITFDASSRNIVWTKPIQTGINIVNLIGTIITTK